MVPRNGKFKSPRIRKTNKNPGDLTSFSGKEGNIEIVVYGGKSIFAKNQILKYSQDPLARSIAAQELLELMNVVAVPVPHSIALEMGTMATQTANATANGAAAAVGTIVATS